MKDIFLLLPSHLFPLSYLKEHKEKTIVLIEPYDYFSRYQYQKKRLIFFLESMRNHRDLLEKEGFSVRYLPISEKTHLFPSLFQILPQKADLHTFTIEDRYLEKGFKEFCEEKGFSHEVHPSPLFLHTEKDRKDFFQKTKKPRMKPFYEQARKHFDLLMDGEKPKGGKWSFDQENRKPLPKSQSIARRSLPPLSPNHQGVVKDVEKLFSKRIGDEKDFWLPTTRKDALIWLEDFLETQFLLFGPFEDAISPRDPFLFHSVISPLLNIGLITPHEVVEKAVSQKNIPINSLEGFIRQVIGWREFIRGIDQYFGEKEESTNFFSHKRRLTHHWYEGTTGIPILDDTIKKAIKYGYCHHIERLMVLSNLMLLAEIDPKEVFVWFMELFVDSADWVMVPNVYGMGQFSDGGIFATKPYFCGSNYLIKMSDYAKEEWCQTIDGLYWRFVDKKRAFLQKQPRLNMMTRLYDKMDPKRKSLLNKKAEEFLNHFTQ